MKVFLIAALTIDGFIAKNPEHLVDWVSKEDKQFFQERVKQAGVVVMGLNTYNTFKTSNRPLPSTLNIVYSKTEKDLPDVEVTQEEPKKLLENLAKRGYKEVAVIGGAQIYTLFLAAGVVDTIYATTEAQIWGMGMNMFTKKFDYKLERTSVTELSLTSLLVEYKVINNRLL